MSPEEVAQALKTMGHHVAELGKIWVKVSMQFSA